MLATKAGASAASLMATRRCLPPKLPFSTSAIHRVDFTHAVIGGGVIGLAIAQQLARRPGSSTVLLERHPAVGTETSSRNSEVVHAGLYYPADSLKTRLCVRGRRMLYALCARRAIPHARVGKWIVAQNEEQAERLARVHEHASRPDVGVPTRWVSAAEVREKGEGVRAEAGALESPETGIVDTHSLMLCLRGFFEEAGGDVVLRADVTGVRALGGPVPGSAGWEINVRDAASGDTTSITAETMINAAGLAATAVHNMIVPSTQRLRSHFAKGNYFAYTARQPRITRLIYPAPQPAAAGLGTHLTIDLAGRMRFGPDVEWVDSPDDWSVSAARVPQALREIRKYLPAVEEACLMPEYAGIRPKLHGPEHAAFCDLVIRKEAGFEGWVNLLGIESPGLTSCLAVAERVEALLYDSASV